MKANHEHDPLKEAEVLGDEPRRFLRTRFPRAGVGVAFEREHITCLAGNEEKDRQEESYERHRAFLV
jgi:hypothetical protein